MKIRFFGEKGESRVPRNRIESNSRENLVSSVPQCLRGENDLTYA